MLAFDLDVLYETANDLSTGVEVRLVEAALDLAGEVFQMCENEAKFLALTRRLRCPRGFLLQPRHALARFGYARFEFGLFQQAIFVGINQATDAPLNSTDLLLHLIQIDVGSTVAREAPFEFLFQYRRTSQQSADIGPDRSVQSIQADRPELADLGATKSKGIHPDAAVVRVRCPIIVRESRDALSIPSVTAAAAHDQSLQKIAGAANLLSMMLAVLIDLCRDSIEQFGADNGRHRNHDLVLDRTRIAR